MNEAIPLERLESLPPPCPCLPALHEVRTLLPTMIVYFYHMPKWQSQVIMYWNLKAMSPNKSFMYEVLSTLSVCRKQTHTRHASKALQFYFSWQPLKFKFGSLVPFLSLLKLLLVEILLHHCEMCALCWVYAQRASVNSYTSCGLGQLPLYRIVSDQ